MKDERIIVITGASGGLAEELIKRLPQKDQLILLGRSKEKLEELYVRREKKVCYQIDITNDKAVHSIVDKIYEEYGGVDILINNAGFGEFKDFNQYTDDMIRSMFDVNTLATIQFSRLIGQRMAKDQAGHIINIASIAGLIATSKSTIYSATKFAVIGFSNALRLELADRHVYVTTVNPGPIATKFFNQADPSGEYLKSVEEFTMQPGDVARRILRILGKNKRELNMPFTLKAAYKAYVLFPKLSDFLARKVFNYK
ncbi:SDR family NAD(P)-dependent oxidoreductase [Streptococcus macacae]|uniref:KR domain protein n=1 Tax=Streptococcus macacae NCTC 11558 TaxID=764298 RepID=G5JVP7_9STRE|nr:SDR family oxidoreductase [Streptococcus macacae]EHJ52919.1 KR domain protein [Streptococcus macacae NCTC 11558]SUN78714.1 oxidoreductase [Streptococcus macacae NCTC 11558]